MACMPSMDGWNPEQRYVLPCMAVCCIYPPTTHTIALLPLPVGRLDRRSALLRTVKAPAQLMKRHGIAAENNKVVLESGSGMHH